MRTITERPLRDDVRLSALEYTLRKLPIERQELFIEDLEQGTLERETVNSEKESD